jgi:hypothetical protein
MSHSCRVVLVAVCVACSSQRVPESPTPESPAPGLSPDAGAASAGVAGPGGATAPAVSDAPAVETLFVRDVLADCQGEVARKCLMVRGAESEPWRNLYSAIEGFEYEPSFEYELRVEVAKIPGAPADAPSLRYRLLEVVSKRKSAAP